MTFSLGDAIRTHFFTLIGKWTVVVGWVKLRADKLGKVGKSKYKSFVPSLDRADKKTGLMGKTLIVHSPISVTKWVWMASLTIFAECRSIPFLRFFSDFLEGL